jgi:hypothetical protein
MRARLAEQEAGGRFPARCAHRNKITERTLPTIYVSEALIGEPAGLGERRDGSWLVHYGPIELGRLQSSLFRRRDLSGL